MSNEIQVGDVVMFVPSDLHNREGEPRFAGVVLGIETKNKTYMGWYWVWFGLEGVARKRLDVMDPRSLEVVAAVSDLGELWERRDVVEAFAWRVREEREILRL